MAASERTKRIVAIVGGILVVIASLGLWINSCVSQRYDECERAFNDYMEAPPGDPQPSILSEKWCFNHLVGDAEAGS